MSVWADSFVDAVELILRSTGRACVTGVGKAGLIGAKIQATLASTGTLSYNLHPVEALHGDLGMVHGDDVVIALSKSGSSELVELLPRLRMLGCSVILLTARVDSEAAKHANHVLDIGDDDEACPLGLAPSSSTAAMLAVGDAIALTVMEYKRVEAEQYASYHPGGCARSIPDEGQRADADRCELPADRAHTATLGDCFGPVLNAPLRAGAACVVDDDSRLIGIVTLGRLLSSAWDKGACAGPGGDGVHDALAEVDSGGRPCGGGARHHASAPHRRAARRRR